MQNMLMVIVGGVVGFLVKIAHGRITEKKVDIAYKMDRPTVFSAFPPQLCFQNLKIWNKGNLPAKNLRVSLDRDIIQTLNPDFRANVDEAFERVESDKATILVFQRLLPKDDLIISFKSEKPLPDDLLIAVKSDEMVARSGNPADAKSDSWFVLKSILIAIPSLAIMVFGMSVVMPPLFDFMDSINPFTKKEAQPHCMN
jgi:hypothetical protein